MTSRSASLVIMRDQVSYHMEPFTIAIPDDALADLRARIRATRWPPTLPGIGWQLGTDLGYLRSLLTHWAEEYDWRAAQRRLNSYNHLRVELGSARVHAVHELAKTGSGVPLLVMNGWPSTFAELLPLVPLLTDPAAHGIGGPAFDVVIPSLPGYGFSERPLRVGLNARDTAELMRELMAALGYARFAVHGGDFGASVGTLLGLDHADAVIGLHVLDLDVAPYTGPGSRPLSDAERAYVEHNTAWWQHEGGYKAIQSTKPQTLAYAINDSPAGLAAWVLEKWRSWGDTGGDLDGRFGRDFLLTTLTLYWVTESIATSIRDYYDYRWHGVKVGVDDVVRVPTAVAVTRQYVPEGVPPREYAERLYNIAQWTVMPRGGHFLAVEEPDLLARDIAAFVATCTGHK